jgi:hypothetical protein
MNSHRCAIDLSHEFDLAAPAAGLSHNQFSSRRSTVNKTAFLSAEAKLALRLEEAV